MHGEQTFKPYLIHSHHHATYSIYIFMKHFLSFMPFLSYNYFLCFLSGLVLGWLGWDWTCRKKTRQFGQTRTCLTHASTPKTYFASISLPPPHCPTLHMPFPHLSPMSLLTHTPSCPTPCYACRHFSLLFPLPYPLCLFFPVSPIVRTLLTCGISIFQLHNNNSIINF